MSERTDMNTGEQFRPQIEAAGFPVMNDRTLPRRGGFTGIVVFTIADVMTSETFAAELFVADLFGTERADVIVGRPRAAVRAEMPNAVADRFSVAFNHGEESSALTTNLYFRILPKQEVFRRIPFVDKIFSGRDFTTSFDDPPTYPHEK
jgi:hypothetical protein